MHQLRSALKRAQCLFQRLQKGDAVLAQHQGLRVLTLGKLFQELAFGTAKRCTFFFALFGHLYGNLGGYQTGLLISGRLGFFRFNALALGSCFADVGFGELVT